MAEVVPPAAPPPVRAVSAKMELLGSERTLAENDARLRNTQKEIEGLERDLPRKRTERSRCKGELEAASARQRAASDQQSKTQEELDDLTNRKFALKDELKRANSSLQVQVELVAEATRARDRLSETWTALRKVREEIAALESDAARTAARDAAGADLPTSVVPPQTAQVASDGGSLLDARSLWTGDAEGVGGANTDIRGDEVAVGTSSGRATPSGTSAAIPRTSDVSSSSGFAAVLQGKEAPLPREIRVAWQSQMVLAALQRSLCVRATEMREGLRQWGFALSAAARTQELSRGYELSRREKGDHAAELVEEHAAICRDRATSGETLSHLRTDHEALKRFHGELRETLVKEKAVIDAAQRQREELRFTLDKATSELERRTFENEETGRVLARRQADLERQPVEAAWRSAAAEKLGLQAEDQARRSMKQLEQTRKEMASFQSAHKMLKEAYAKLSVELETHQNAHEALQEEHAQLNLDLNALARHYVDQLPDLPGLSQPPQEQMSLTGFSSGPPPAAKERNPSEMTTALLDSMLARTPPMTLAQRSQMMNVAGKIAFK